MRWLVTRTRATCGASLMIWATSRSLSSLAIMPGQSTQRLPGASACNCVAAFIAASRSTTGVKLFVVDLHEVGGVLRRGETLRHHHRDRVADMHCRLRQHRAERHRHLGAAAADDRRMARDAADAGRLHVRRGQHRQHALGFARRLGVHSEHAGMGVRRAHEGGIGLVLQARVVHETAVAAHQSVVLDARRGFGRAGRCHGRSKNVVCGASFIADTAKADRGLRPACACGTEALPRRLPVFQGTK